MRKFLLPLVASMAVATPALAEPFAGPYVGAEVGVDNYEIKASDVLVAGDEYDGFSGNGIVGGIYAGFDLPLGSNAFAGIEANASISDAKARFSDGVDSLGVKAKESFGASARVGLMVSDSTGAYLRAGWRNTKFEADVNGVSDSDNDDALVLGGGIETRIGANASLRLEYNYVDYSDFVRNNTVRAGVAFRF